MNLCPITFFGMNKNDFDLEILSLQHFLTVGWCENLPLLSVNDPSDPDFKGKICTHTNLIQN